jgi:hypothetical protein
MQAEVVLFVLCVCVFVGGRELASYAGSRSESLFEPLLAVTVQAAAIVIM